MLAATAGAAIHPKSAMLRSVRVDRNPNAATTNRRPRCTDDALKKNDNTATASSTSHVGFSTRDRSVVVAIRSE